MKRVAILAISGAAVAAIAAFLFLRHPTWVEQPAPEPKASIQEIMLTQVDGSADKIWGSSGWISDDKGMHELAPKTEAEWQALRAAVVTLQQAPDLLVQEGRPVGRPGVPLQDEGLEGIQTRDQIQKALVSDRPVLLERAQRLRTVAGEILSAVDRRDIAALERTSGDLDEACEACHQHFWYPPQSKPAPKPKT
jgi:hypothetical protein